MDPDANYARQAARIAGNRGAQFNFRYKQGRDASVGIDVALLDIQLRNETSYPIAERLRERGIPLRSSAATHSTICRSTCATAKSSPSPWNRLGFWRSSTSCYLHDLFTHEVAYVIGLGKALMKGI